MSVRPKSSRSGFAGFESHVVLRPSRNEFLWVFAAALIASVIAVTWSWRHAAFLLYGDAEAHIHIARRVFDSHRPGLSQLGSVWLPLSHLLLIPFLAIQPWWRNGFAPVIPSAACYLLASIGIYRLARRWLSPQSSCVAFVLFAANPNLLYLQTTAMTEPLFLCVLIWSVLLLEEWYLSLDHAPSNPDQSRKRFGLSTTGRLQWAVIAALVAAVYTRYDGWILACMAWVVMAVCLARRGRLVRRSFVLASVVLLLAPLIWMAYNAFFFGDWLDFMRGPYSARAIELRTASSAVNPHPGWHDPWVSLLYFMKAAEMDMAALSWGGIVALSAALGTAWAWLRYGRTHRPAIDPDEQEELRHQRTAVLWTLFLWLPLPFYVYSVSYGSVPIFIPVWTPFSWYNTRYGMELLPALALFTAFTVDGVSHLLASIAYRRILFVVVFAALAVNAAAMLHERPLTYVEAQKNDESRHFYNYAIADALERLHVLDPGGVVLMDTSSFPSIVLHSGLTYRQTLNESDKQFYQAALADPAGCANVILTFDGDEVAEAVAAHPQHLRLYKTFHAKDQHDAAIYVTDTLAATLATEPAPATPAR